MMGSTFGKVSEHEPAYAVLLEVQGPTKGASYELRRYGERFAAEVIFRPHDKDLPFVLLAGYIGLCGNPQNEREEAIGRKNTAETEGKATALDFLAPVVIKYDNTTTTTGETAMQLILPAGYDDISKIPRPTNPKVSIRKLPAAMGAVHRFNGPFSQQMARHHASKLADQLLANGLITLSKEHIMANYQLWGYNPPHTIPLFRRNEVWVELTEDQAKLLIQNFGGPVEPNLLQPDHSRA